MVKSRPDMTPPGHGFMSVRCTFHIRVEYALYTDIKSTPDGLTLHGCALHGRTLHGHEIQIRHMFVIYPCKVHSLSVTCILGHVRDRYYFMSVRCKMSTSACSQYYIR